MTKKVGSMGTALLLAGWTYERSSDAQCGAVGTGRRGTGDCALTAKWRKGRLLLCALHATHAERTSKGGTR